VTRTSIHPARLLALLAGLALLVPSVAVAKKKKDKDEDDEPKVDWKHPWASDRYFDYEDEDWSGKSNPRKDSDLFYDEVHTTLEQLADGRHRTEWEVVLKVNEPESLPALLPVERLDAGRNTEILEFEATYTSGGRVRELGEDRLLEVSPEEGSLYITGDRVLGLLLPRDEPGLLKIRMVAVQDPIGGTEEYFGGSVVVQEHARAALRTITLKVPEASRLWFNRRFFRLKAEETVEDGVRSYKFTFKHLRYRPWDPGMPNVLDAWPVLFFSNMETWEEIGAAKSEPWEEQLVATPEVQAWADALVEGVEGTLPRARAIHDAVADGWDYLGFYPGESGWVPHPAGEVFDARLGDCKDQTALMVTGMRAVGIDADPAVIFSGLRVKTAKVPAVVTNHVIVHVTDPEHPEGGFFLDSVDTGTGAFPVSQNLANREALVLDPDGAFLKKVPLAGRETRLHDSEVVIRFEADGLARLTIEDRWHGEAANGRLNRRRQTDPHTWDRRIRERLRKAVPGGRIEALEEGLDPEQPDVWLQTAELVTDRLVVHNGEHALINLPWLDSWPTRIHVEGRRLHPREIHGSWTRSKIRIQLPEGAELVHHPGQGGEERDAFSCSIDSQLVDRELQVELQVEFVPGRMTRKHEEVRRNFHLGLAKLQRRPVVLLMPEVQP